MTGGYSFVLTIRNAGSGRAACGDPLQSQLPSGGKTPGKPNKTIDFKATLYGKVMFCFGHLHVFLNNIQTSCVSL